MTGLYIHFPFCKQKCKYCDFVSFSGKEAYGKEYVSCLLKEMKEYNGTPIDTVYLGGGTPTALDTSLICEVLSGVGASFTIGKDAEITIEANPGTCSLTDFTRLKNAGVNRVSLGVQSFVDEELAALGRIHSAKEAKEAVFAIREAGIDNISLDLMFSIPGQTDKSLAYSLKEALSLSPCHISVYSLMLSPETPLFNAYEKGEFTLPTEEEDRERYTFLVEYLKQKGYDQYEFSNFAKPGFRARHNTKYWTRDPYIGLGVSAHSFFDNCRYENPSTFKDYFARVLQGKRPQGEIVSQKDAMAEFVYLGLRLTEDGISRRNFYASFGVSFDSMYTKPLEKLTSLGLLEDDGERIRLTPRGIDVSNGVFCEFL